MKFKYLIIGILLIGAIILAGCVQKKVSVKELPACEFPRQIGEYSTDVVGEIPTIYPQNNHQLAIVSYVNLNKNIGIKIKIFENEADSEQEFENTNYYTSQDCEIIGGRTDCLEPSGKSTNDRSCNILGVEGRCVSIVDSVAGSWIVEFEWIENKENKNIKMTGNEPLKRSDKFKILEPFVEQFKNCIVK